MKVEYHAQTASDLNSAVAHYNERREGLGDSLRAEVYAAIDRICLNPDQYRPMEGDVRRCFVRRFPYSILKAALYLALREGAIIKGLSPRPASGFLYGWSTTKRLEPLELTPTRSPPCQGVALALRGSC